jgi:hypothetical protein
MANSDVVPSGRSVIGPSFYWVSFNDAAGFDGGDDGHLVFGGQRPPFSLVGSVGQTWPRAGQPDPLEQLQLPHLVTTQLAGGGRSIDQRPPRILRHTVVGGRDALVLAAPPYPDGGFMGGHVIVLWNRQQHGYMLSFHYQSSRTGHIYALSERVAAAINVARSFKPTRS